MMHCCVLQLNMHVFPTPVRTEARVTKSRAGLSATVHQAGRAPLVLKVRKPSVHLPVCLFPGSICSVWRPSYRPRLEHRHPSPPQHVSRCCCQCAAWLLVMLGCVRYMAGEAGLGSWQHSRVPSHGKRSLSSYGSRIRVWWYHHWDGGDLHNLSSLWTSIWLHKLRTQCVMGRPSFSTPPVPQSIPL